MTKHSLRVRLSAEGSIRGKTPGTAAINALAEIPGVGDVTVVEETDEEAVLEFMWDDDSEKFWRTEEVLRKHGIERI